MIRKSALISACILSYAMSSFCLDTYVNNKFTGQKDNIGNKALLDSYSRSKLDVSRFVRYSAAHVGGGGGAGDITTAHFNAFSTSTQIKLNNKVSSTKFTNNSTYTAAHIRALVDPHPAPGSNKQVAYNNRGVWGGASLLNYTGSMVRIGAATITPNAQLHVIGNMRSSTGIFNNISVSTGGKITAIGSNSIRSAALFNPSAQDDFGMLAIYPLSTSANSAAALQVIPKGTGYPGFPIRAQLSVFGTDYIADATNYEFLTLRASGVDYSINASLGGTGQARPITFQMANNPKVTYSTTGKVGIGHALGDATTIHTPRSVLDTYSSSSGKGRTYVGSDTNYVVQDQNLGIRLKGKAINWDDMTIPLSIARLSTLSTPPTWASFQGTEVPSFSATATNTLFFTLQLPHNYQEGADISCHGHFGYINNGAGNVRLQMTYSWANVSAAFPAATTVTTTFAAPAVTNQHVIHDFGTLSGTGKTISSMILFSLARLGADAADTYASVINGVSFDCHVPRDGIGSDLSSTKSATP